MATTCVDDIKEASGVMSFADHYEFMLDGITYQIDLDQENKQKLDAAVQVFIDHARIKDSYMPVTRRPIQAYRKSNSGLPQWFQDNNITAADIRQWCRDNNIPVNDMGRIPATIAQEYENAHRQPQSRKQDKLQSVYTDPVLQPFSTTGSKK